MNYLKEITKQERSRRERNRNSLRLFVAKEGWIIICDLSQWKGKIGRHKSALLYLTLYFHD